MTRPDWNDDDNKTRDTYYDDDYVDDDEGSRKKQLEQSRPQTHVCFSRLRVLIVLRCFNRFHLS